MKDGERAARAQGAQGIGDDIAAAEPRPDFHETSSEVNRLARRVIEAAVEVHRHLGPGYAESVYENALAIEFDLRGIPYQRQATFSIGYKGRDVGAGRVDILVERTLIVELKAIERYTDVHVSQAISYLKATGHELALLINFDVPVLMRGVKRVVLNHPRSDSESIVKPLRE
ncbi:MAG: GxxExxY protein [Polyangiaceae bacterium]|nr:GxxExxY protein [Polyangiaceae bacterium]